MAVAGLHLQSIDIASTALVVGEEEEAGVPQIAVVVPGGFLGAQNTEVMLFSCLVLLLTHGSTE